MIRLMNSAMMPMEGYYSLKKVSMNDFVDELKSNDFISYIGYKETIQLIEPLIEKTIPYSRINTEINGGDIMLIVKLKYRVQDSIKKGAVNPSINDFEFYRATFYDRHNTIIN